MRGVLVTGGAGGIGMACARMFLDAGSAVHLVDIDGDRLEAARATLAPLGSVTTHRSPLDTPGECREAFASFGRPADALVHMAGIFEPDPLDADDRQVWQRAIGSNLTNAYDMAIAFRAQRAQSASATTGRIVLCSSRAFQRGAPGRAAYTAAKGGIVGLMRTFSREFAPHILVNAIAPGLIETRMTSALIASAGAQRLSEIPLGRFGTPEDIAGLIAFMCSSRGRWLHGATIDMDGGEVKAV